MIYKEVEIDQQVCCDYCNEIIHIHFDCPICKNGHNKTDIYGESMYEYLKETNIFSCEECGTKFVVHEYDYGYVDIEVKND